MSGTPPGIQDTPADRSRRGKDAAVNRVVGIRIWPGLLAAVAVLAAWFGLGWLVAAQSLVPTDQLVAADPMPNARLAVAPDQIALTFPVPVTPGSARIRLLATGSAEIPLGSVQAAPDLPARVWAAAPGNLGSGDYTVVWSARAAADGRLLAGAYPFRAGVVSTPGATELPGQWPAPWATLLRWLVFLGTAVAGGGFAWGRLLSPRPGHRSPTSRLRLGVMTIAALAALLATASAPILAHFTDDDGGSAAITAALRAMPFGWWLQSVALIVLVLLCLAVMLKGSAAVRERAELEWLGVGAGLAALGGLGLTSHAASPVNVTALTFEMLHLWSTALWFSALLFLLAGWRGLGSDVARFRTVRWVGGLLLVVSVVTGLARAAPLFPSFGDLIAHRYGQVLAGKTGIVLIIVALGGVAMLAPRRANALRASRFLGTQGLCAALAVLLSALLALMAAPGTVTPATLVGVALGDVVPLDRTAFDTGSGMIHLLTQPVTPGPQTLVVRLTDTGGTALTVTRAPAVQVSWTIFGGEAATAIPIELQTDPSGALFTGAVTLSAGWWQADVAVTPPGGIASLARFWLVVPDPNVVGSGPIAPDDPEATALYERGLASLTSLRSVRYTQSLADGSGSFVRSRVFVNAAEGERPAAYDETILGADGNAVARQTIIGNRRWILEDGAWAAAEPIPFQVPAAWGQPYAGATGFHLGPREAIDGELSQVVTFSVPSRSNPTREPAWYAWWVGLASGQVRREAMISTRHYMVTEYRDFNAPLTIEPPVAESALPATPTGAMSTPEATPAAEAEVESP
jgi:putative copper export protein/methionine-rich copper-binding protein CopC